MKELLFFETIQKDAVWGSEYWTVSAHPNGDCIVKDGTFKGEHLSALWHNHKSLFGDVQSDRFPLLVKVIDAKADLSIQVHPGDEYAQKNENGSLGKTECWYILEASEGEKIVFGHNAGSRAEAERMISQGLWSDLIKKVGIKKSNFILIEPGTVHSICGGTKLIEIQQSSDITYRFYDYDRIVDGKKRELHIDKSLDVTTIPDKSSKNFHESFPDRGFETPCFKISKVSVKDKETLDFKGNFIIASVTEGEGKIDGHVIKRGDSFIVPADYGEAVIDGCVEMLLTSP